MERGHCRRSLVKRPTGGEIPRRGAPAAQIPSPGVVYASTSAM